MRRGGLLIGALVGVLLLAGCGGGDEGGGAGAGATTTAPQTTAAATTTTAAAGGADDEVQLTAQGFKWDPASFQLPAGSEVKVEVRNQDSATHSFTFQEGGADQDIPGGENASVTFTAPEAGSYQFLCKYHPSAMTGTVTVT